MGVRIKVKSIYFIFLKTERVFLVKILAKYCTKKKVAKIVEIVVKKNPKIKFAIIYIFTPF